VRWTTEQQRRIQQGMRAIKNTHDAESVDIMKEAFAGILAESRYSVFEQWRVRCIEMNFLGKEDEPT